MKSSFLAFDFYKNYETRFLLVTIGLLAAPMLMMKILIWLMRIIAPSTHPLTRSEAKWYCCSSNSIEDNEQQLPVDISSQTKEQSKYDLSVIIPAYNEQSRIAAMLGPCVETLVQMGLKSEIIVVDDGSKDETLDVVVEFIKALDYTTRHRLISMKVLKLDTNRGKGRAVTCGMLCASGELCLFADADGATEFSDLSKLISSIKRKQQQQNQVERDNEDGNNVDIAIGSRAHLVKTDSVVKRSRMRNLLMLAFHLVLYCLSTPYIRQIHDTQCGFKLFTRRAVHRIFPFMHLEGWLFDIELLHIASQKGLRCAEVPVDWHEVPGSKLSIIRDAIRMAVDLLELRLCYLLGVWRVDTLTSYPQWRRVRE
ncbi:hypothetical protein MIR68_001939 [Amoeboaphelidium protococcarum]|nr:hypothetical protein MIR68_001939 [Amoeboaphelidium protococcarum]